MGGVTNSSPAPVLSGLFLVLLDGLLRIYVTLKLSKCGGEFDYMITDSGDKHTSHCATVATEWTL